MVGFKNIFISNAYNPEDYNVKDSRLACIAQKLESDSPSVYYEKQQKIQIMSLVGLQNKMNKNGIVDIFGGFGNRFFNFVLPIH